MTTSSSEVAPDDVARRGARQTIVAPTTAKLCYRMAAAMMVAVLDRDAMANHIVVADTPDALRPVRRHLKENLDQAGVPYRIAQTADENRHMFVVLTEEHPTFWAFLLPEQVKDPDAVAAVAVAGCSYWWLAATDSQHSMLRTVSERENTAVVVGRVLAGTDRGGGGK